MKDVAAALNGVGANNNGNVADGGVGNVNGNNGKDRSSKSGAPMTSPASTSGSDRAARIKIRQDVEKSKVFVDTLSASDGRNGMRVAGCKDYVEKGESKGVGREDGGGEGEKG